MSDELKEELKEYLLQLLKDNLRIEIESSDGSCYDSASIEVKLFVDDECISHMSCRAPTQRDNNY